MGKKKLGKTQQKSRQRHRAEVAPPGKFGETSTEEAPAHEEPGKWGKKGEKIKGGQEF